MAPQGADREAALAEIRDVVAGPRGKLRTDLLNEAAVLFRGLEAEAANDPMRGKYRAWVALLIDAGADAPMPEQWQPVADHHAHRPTWAPGFSKPFAPDPQGADEARPG